MSKRPSQKKENKPGARLPQGKKQGLTKSQKEKIIMIVMIAAAVVMALAATVAVLYTRWVKKPTLPSASDTSQAPSPTVSGQPADPNVSELPEEPDYDPVQPKVSGERKSEDFYTILVFGADVTSGLTDTIMVVSYDITNQKATVMSIPRDTLINVRSRSSKSINAVYNINGKGEKGIEALKKEVSELIGFTPDYYVMIDWELVGKMVDAIGGVYFDIPYHMDYDDPDQDLHIHFDTGNQFLNGEDAMKVVRWRKNNRWSDFWGEGGGSDLNRLGVQHEFLKAVLKQTLQFKNLTRISQLAELFGENVVSDLTVENLFWFGSQAIFGGLNVDDVEFVTMPTLGVNDRSNPYYGRVYPSQKQLLSLLNESLNPFLENITIRQLDLIRVNSDGTLSSSTGVLADPSAAIPPVVESEAPEDDPDDPDGSIDPDDDDLNGTDNPGSTENPGDINNPAVPGATGEPNIPTDPSVTDEPNIPTDPGESGSGDEHGAGWNPDSNGWEDPGAVDPDYFNSNSGQTGNGSDGQSYVQPLDPNQPGETGGVPLD